MSERMRPSLLIGIFAFILLGSSIYPAIGQSDSNADHIVINEVDINPPGDDSKSISEWVELHNPTDNYVDIGGWSIASTTVLKKTLTIPHGTVIKPGGFLTYSYVSVWFTDVSELVQLKDDNGVVIDQTPSITDVKNDFTSWQRNYDGVDTDSSDDWKFETSTAGSSNGQLTAGAESEIVSVSISSDKDSYLFDETAVITGDVSKRVFQEKPFFHPAEIKITIFGPNAYEKNITLYPDLFLKFKTELGLRKVLGISEGAYLVTVAYTDAKSSIGFSVGEEFITIEEKESSPLLITSDKQSYLPGDRVTISASSPEIVQFEGLKFRIIAPSGQQISDGNLFPDLTGSFALLLDDIGEVAPDAQFFTSFYIDTIAPQYGTYRIIAEYSVYASETSFEVTKDVKEAKLISLNTDKDAYGLGETVIISGRLNNLWIPSLDLEVLQTSNLALGVLDFVGGGNNFKILDAVRLEGDSTFRYEAKIPNNPESYGDYRVTVSKEVGSATIFFKVVENPDEYTEEVSKIFSVRTDKTTYESGDRIVISGKINNIVASSSYYTATVDISVKSAKGTDIFTFATKPSSSEPGQILYSLTAVPDTFGNYEVRDTLFKAIYDEGPHLVTATYADGLYRDTTSFSIIDPLNIDEPLAAWLDKEVYGLGEEVHLTGIAPFAGATKAGLGITITKPDGDTNKFGTTIDSGRFSWSWTTPIAEKSQTVLNERSVISSNYGIYKMSISQADNPPVVLFFKVSPHPEEDSLVVEPLTVTTEKPLYNAGEKLKVIGSAMKRPQGTEGLVVPDRVTIVVSSGEFPYKEIYEARVYLDAGGRFSSTFDTPVTIFKDGTYKVIATYQNIKAENIFQVDNDFIKEADVPLSLILDTDKDEYYPGDIAKITARPTKTVFVETIRIGVPTEEQTKINCGAFVCGQGVPISVLRPDPNGSFHLEHEFPDTPDSIGTYIITIDTEFGTFTKMINVVEKPPEIKEILKPFTEKIIEKFNRITESFVPISINDKTIDERAVSPRVIQGSLFTPSRGEESNVNIKVTTEDGRCIIGPEQDCMISKSTRIPGAIYQTVEIDGIDYKIRYSGPDVKLEKFTILPEATEGTLPEMTWNVEVLKDEQSSRLYYKISYVPLE